MRAASLGWWVIGVAACSAGDATGIAAQREVAGTSVLSLLDDHLYLLPFDVPDALLDVPDLDRAGRTVSLAEGDVTSAWRTTAAPDGTPSAVVYRCVAGRWQPATDAWLAPLEIALEAYPDLDPFTARQRGAEISLDATVRIGGGVPLPSQSRFEGVVEVTWPGAGGDDLPLARLRKAQGFRLGPFAGGGVDHADFALRLRTRGGAGPGAGSPCGPGDAPLRVPFDAELWLVRLGHVTAADASP